MTSAIELRRKREIKARETINDGNGRKVTIRQRHTGVQPPEVAPVINGIKGHAMPHVEPPAPAVRRRPRMRGPFG